MNFSILKGEIRNWDIRLFYHINGLWHNGFLDAVLPFMRNPYFWAPLYLFLLVFMVLNFRFRGALWVLFFLLTFGITDFTCSHLFKFWVQRLRPCNDPVVSAFTRLLVPCGSGFSFPSSHATNHFGMAMFMFLTLRPLFGKWMNLAFAWAFVISYAQIYVGVHYPVDTFCGAMLGLLAGWATGWVFNSSLGLEGNGPGYDLLRKQKKG
ncbi:MAG TPA: phosphatase PAP2 family protein [Chitinophagaceae bacterium]|nr:phosphatase PAP2 family protein [Chitinophagaceae bacterium]